MGRVLVQQPGTNTAKALTETLPKNVIIVDEALHQLRLHDGVTPGGYVIGGGGGIGNIDDITITENANQEIQAVAVIDQNTGIAKTWTGTTAEYEAIVTKDPETEYIITDDVGGSAIDLDFRKEVSERNIGEIVYSTIHLTDSGLHLADGEILDGTGIYKDFYDYMVAKSATAPEIFTTEANWQAEVAANGVCGKYVLDTGLVSIRLPKLKNKLLSDNAVVGNGMALGLTDGTNTAGVNSFANSTGLDPWTGLYGTSVGTAQSGSRVNANKAMGVTTDGTKSGIEVASSIDIYCYVVLANTAKIPVQVDIDNITTELNACYAHRVVEFQEPTAQNNYTWYRKYADGWVEQGGHNQAIQADNTDHWNYINLPVTMANTNYTTSIVLFGNHDVSIGIIPQGSLATTRLCIGGYYTATSDTRYTAVDWQVSGMAA